VLMATGFGATTAQPAVVDVMPVTIQSFTATPATIDLGGNSLLQWQTEWATSVAIDQGVGPVPPSGAAEVAPQNNTTYTLSAQGSQGPATATATVDVASVAITSFAADPPQVQDPGDTVTLSWTVVNPTACSIDQGIGAVNATGSVQVQPGQSQTYTLTAAGPNGPVTVACPVTVVNEPAITSLQPPDQSQYNPGDEVDVSWSTQGCASCQLNIVTSPGGGYVYIGGVLPSGGYSFTIGDSDVQITLTCTGPFSGSNPVSASAYIASSGD
jgi:plastocyanin